LDGQAPDIYARRKLRLVRSSAAWNVGERDPPEPEFAAMGPIQYVVTSMDNAALARLVTTFKSSDHEAAG
jgi:hypothetical protein